jgi:ketosteroid isomerase-like protein
MTWFTETPWPLIVILGIAACACLAVWTSQKRGIWLIAVAILAADAVAVFVIEKSVVTEAERVEQQVFDLTGAFQRKDRDRVLSFFSLQAPELRKMANDALDLVDFPNGIDVKDVSVRMSNENTRAVSHFRANGTVSVKGFAQYSASRWEVTWQKEGNDWKIVEVIRLDPVKDEKMQILERRPN